MPKPGSTLSHAIAWCASHLTARLGLLVFLFHFVLVASTQADWPHLRGPNYDGVSLETGLADAWPVGGPALLWTRELGQGHSGLIVAEGKVFMQRQTLGGQTVLCLDLQTGTVLWETRYDWAWQPGGAYPGPYATPTWYRGKLFYCSPTGLVGCLNAESGAPVWSLNVRDKFHGKGCEFGYAATPLVENDLMKLPVGGPEAGMVALHVDDGRVVWTVGSDPASYCPAFPITIDGRRCVVGYLQNGFVVVDAVTGKLLLRQPSSGGYDEHSAWPVFREPHLFLASPFRQPASCMELRLNATGGALTSRLRWGSPEMSNDIVSSILYRDHLYGFHLKQLQASPHRPSRGSFHCLEWTTGKLCWSTDQVGQSSLIAAEGKLFMLTDTGGLILARADSTEYQELGRVQLFEDEICWTPPTLHEGRLLVRSPSRVVCLFVGRPENMPAAQNTMPALSKSRSWHLDASWLLSRERDYPNDAPTFQEMLLWFGSCLVLLLGSAGVIGMLQAAAKWLFSWQIGAPFGFWWLVFVLGCLGPNFISIVFDGFLFTWPLSLYAGFHLTTLVCAKAAREESRWSGWMARLAMAGFLVVCFTYFEACKLIGMFVGWAFLVGLPFAFPLTCLAVRSRTNPWRVLMPGIWSLLAFTVFFWSCEALLQWKIGHRPW